MDDAIHGAVVILLVHRKVTRQYFIWLPWQLSSTVCNYIPQGGQTLIMKGFFQEHNTEWPTQWPSQVSHPDLFYLWFKALTIRPLHFPQVIEKDSNLDQLPTRVTSFHINFDHGIKHFKPLTLKWPRENFSLHYQYNINQISDEIKKISIWG